MGNDVSRALAMQSHGGRKMRNNIDSIYAEAYQVTVRIEVNYV